MTATNPPRFWPLAAGLALLIAAARGAWVLHGLPEMPFLDAWSAVDGIALPLASGTFDPHYLVRLHNEHPLTWTKLLDLIELRLADDQFDARPAGLLVALATAAVAGLLLAGAARRIGEARVAFLVAGVALFALPYAWENLTEDWGNPYLFLIFGAIATLRLSACGRGPLAAVMLVPALLLSVLAMASGWIAPALGIAVVAERARRGDLARATALAFVLLQGAAIALAAWLLHGAPETAATAPREVALTIVQLLIAGVAFLPAFAFGRALLAGDVRPSAGSRRNDLFIAALALWGFTHVAAMVLARPQFRLWLPFSRYMDLLPFALLADMACALRLAAGASTCARNALAAGVRIVAATAVLAAPLPVALYLWQADRFEQAQALVARTVQRHDTAAIARADDSIVPHPDRGYLLARLADPRVRSIVAPSGSCTAPKT